MNVLVVDLGAVWGGQEIYSLNLMNALRKQGHYVVSLSSNQKHQSCSDKYYSADIAYSAFVGISKVVKRLVIEHSIDVVHMNGNRAMYLAAFLKLPVRLVATKHLPFFVNGSKPLKHQIARWLSGSLFRVFDHIICVSQATFNDLPNVCKAKASVIANGVPDRRIIKDNPIKGEELKLSYVARLVEHKGILPLMKGVIAAQKMGVNCSLLIAGDGPLRPEVERMVAVLPKSFRYYGFLDDPAAIYNQADVCCLPSLNEGMPLNILEAFSCGLPVLAVNIPGVNEVVNDNNGWLLNDNSSASIAHCLMSIAEQKEIVAVKSIAARKCYEDKYSIEMMVEKTLAIYGD